MGQVFTAEYVRLEGGYTGEEQDFIHTGVANRYYGIHNIDDHHTPFIQKQDQRMYKWLGYNI
jgi:hypothetical protein